MKKYLVKVCKNGTKVWEEEVKCDRCGGVGIYFIAVCNNQGVPAHPDNGRCFKCGGTGRMIQRTLEYTPEHEAELEAQRKARAEKKAAEWKAQQAEREAERLAKEIDECHRRALIENKWFDQKQAEIKASEYQGEVGKKITVKIVNVRSVSYEATFGWRTTTKHIYIMKDASGNTYTWNTENYLGYDVETDGKEWYREDSKGRHYYWHIIEDDEEFMITGTVKEHKEYDGVKQTVLTRCKMKAA